MVKISYIFVSTLAVLALVVLTTWIKKDIKGKKPSQTKDKKADKSAEKTK